MAAQTCAARRSTLGSRTHGCPDVMLKTDVTIDRHPQLAAAAGTDRFARHRIGEPGEDMRALLLVRAAKHLAPQFSERSPVTPDRRKLAAGAYRA